MGLGQILLVLLLGLPAHHLDEESEDQRQARLEIVADAIVDAVDRATCQGRYSDEACERIWPGAKLDLAVLLVTQAYWESRLAQNIHEGNCRSYECDPHTNPRTGKREHRSRTMWQIQYSSLVAAEWDRMIGATPEATRAAAWAATKLLSRGYRSCRTISGAISRYAGLGRCTWSGAAQRAHHYEQLRLKATRIAARASEQRQDKPPPPPKADERRMSAGDVWHPTASAEALDCVVQAKRERHAPRHEGRIHGSSWRKRFTARGTRPLAADAPRTWQATP